MKYRVANDSQGEVFWVERINGEGEWEPEPHDFYFDDEEDAIDAANRLEEEGW